MPNDELPVVCTLRTGELAERRAALLPGLLSEARSREELPSGVRVTFDMRHGLIEEVAAVVAAEHRCCAFLRFELRVEPADGPLILDVTGPPGTKEFLGGLS
jgi:hypothetical protein